ncbi:hypothetical protein POPTR_004G214833v4 [Populus trichocarpa]|uniref:Uncharacterized protein n=1 Tax=Populus trichocarpa TaxID=3694 RepID=A0ACC0T605_POPTR|nr:hypothetical protein POPTR_004G214833v4 [Populus trichocarpa]
MHANMLPLSAFAPASFAFVLFLTPQTKSSSVDTVCGTIRYGN